MKKIILSFLLLLPFILTVYAEVPNEIRYNGRLKSYQTPVNGTKKLKFQIYSAETGGGPALWDSGDLYIPVTNGIFSCTLTPNVDWRKKDLWLQLVVEGKELGPREKLMAQPYALHSDSAESLTSNNEMNVKAGANAGKIGVNANGEVYSKASETEFYMVPKGTIVLWYGDPTTIPSGWILCNGSNGTPDMRGRVAVGYGSIIDSANKSYDFTTVGQLGGEVNHTLTIAEMPSHSHSYNMAGGTQRKANGNSDSIAYTDTSSVQTGGVGSSAQHNNMPPYNVLCYIMKK